MCRLSLDDNEPWDPIRRGVQYDGSGSGGHVVYTCKSGLQIYRYKDVGNAKILSENTGNESSCRCTYRSDTGAHNCWT